MLLLCTSPAWAQVKLLRDGKQQASYSSIQAAVNAAVAGDTVQIDNSERFECVSVTRSGTASKPITIIGSGNASAINGAIKTIADGSATWVKSGSRYYTATTIDLKLTNTAMGAYRDGTRLWSYRTDATMGTFKVGSGIFYNQSQRRLYLRLSSGSDPKGQKLSIGRCDHALSFLGAQHVVVKNLIVKNGTRSTIGIGSPSASASFITLDGLTVKNGFAGILIRNSGSHDNTVKNSTVQTSYSSSWYWSDFKETPSEMEGAAIRIQNCGTNTKIENCTLSGYFDGITTWADQGTNVNANVTIANNTISNIFDDGIELESGDKNTRVYGNRVFSAFVALSLAPTRSGPVYVYDNVLAANRLTRFQRGQAQQYGAVFKFGSSSVASTSAKLYHNTAFGMAHVLGGDWGGTIGPKNFEWYNNIFYSHGGPIISSTGLASDGNKFNGNIYYQRNAGVKFEGFNCRNSCGKYASLSAARNSSAGKAAKWELAGLESDPQFIDLGKLDLGLKADSPARDRAIAVPSSWPKRPTPTSGSKPDVGAREFQVAEPPDPKQDGGTVVGPLLDASMILPDATVIVDAAAADALRTTPSDGGARPTGDLSGITRIDRTVKSEKSCAVGTSPGPSSVLILLGLLLLWRRRR